MGSCAGGAVYSPAMTDFIFMVRDTSQMFITGPDVVKTVTGEEVTLEQLGGALTHATKSGVAAFVTADEKSCLDEVRYLLGFLPSNNLEEPPRVDTGDDPERLVPEVGQLIPPSPNQPYDMKKVIAAVVDDGEFFEYHALWAMNLVCGFARIDGHVVGIVGNQPQVLAGVLDIESSEKGARFVRTCDSFNIPLVTFVDVPGFMPGTDQEYGGIIRHGAKLLYAYCESTVPRIQIITRKAYGGAYVVMNSKSIGADLAFAWPSAELAVMGPQGAVDIVYRRELATSPDAAGRRAQLVEEYTERFANPYLAAERGYVDDVIDPAETRRVLSRSLDLLRSKREELPKRKHGNVPAVTDSARPQPRGAGRHRGRRRDGLAPPGDHRSRTRSRSQPLAILGPVVVSSADRSSRATLAGPARLASVKRRHVSGGGDRRRRRGRGVRRAPGPPIRRPRTRTEQPAGAVTVRTLRRPPGDRLATVATVNDLHFGETRCGVIAGVDLGPVLHAEPGAAALPARDEPAPPSRRSSPSIRTPWW